MPSLHIRLLLERSTLRWLLRCAPPLLERPNARVVSLYCWLNLRNFRTFFCETTDARPILTVDTTDPMVGKSHRRGYVP
jgi:hypothetical protein